MISLSQFYTTSITIEMEIFGNQAYFHNSNAIFDHTQEPLLSREEALNLIGRLCDFYEIYTDAEIDQYNQEHTTPKPTSSPRIGFVYLMRSNGLYKIGHTFTSVQARQLELQRGNPNTVEQVCAIKTAGPKELEYELHAQFQSKRIRGEWFALDIGDIQHIQAMAEAKS